jgi:hypothetical protein
MLLRRVLLGMLAVALVFGLATGCSSEEPAETEPAQTEPAVEQIKLAAIVESGEIPETVVGASLGSWDRAEGARLLALEEVKGLYWEGGEEDIHAAVQNWREAKPDHTFYIMYSEPVDDGVQTKLIGVYSLTPTFDTVSYHNGPYEER